MASNTKGKTPAKEAPTEPFKRAVTGALRALARKPDYVAALVPMASVLFARQDYLRARAFLQRSESASTAGPEVLHLGMQIEQALGDKRSAEEYRRRLLDSYPRSREALSLGEGE